MAQRAQLLFKTTKDKRGVNVDGKAFLSAKEVLLKQAVCKLV